MVLPIELRTSLPPMRPEESPIQELLVPPSLEGKLVAWNRDAQTPVPLTGLIAAKAPLEVATLFGIDPTPHIAGSIPNATDLTHEEQFRISVAEIMRDPTIDLNRKDEVIAMLLKPPRLLYDYVAGFQIWERAIQAGMVRPATQEEFDQAIEQSRNDLFEQFR